MTAYSQDGNRVTTTARWLAAHLEREENIGEGLVQAILWIDCDRSQDVQLRESISHR